MCYSISSPGCSSGHLCQAIRATAGDCLLSSTGLFLSRRDTELLLAGPSNHLYHFPIVSMLLLQIHHAQAAPRSPKRSGDSVPSTLTSELWLAISILFVGRQPWNMADRWLCWQQSRMDVSLLDIGFADLTQQLQTVNFTQFFMGQGGL